jgi:hypothetical protein
MRWLEFIKVQAAATQGQAAVLELLDLVLDLRKMPGLVEAVVCDHASVYGDVAILLLWETDQSQRRGSPVGLNLNQAMQKFGLVSHSVWIVKDKTSRGKKRRTSLSGEPRLETKPITA